MKASFLLQKYNDLTKDQKTKRKLFKLFSNILDDVTVTQYNERGGSINDLTDNERKIKNYLEQKS